MVGSRKKYRAPIEAIGLFRKTASREDIAESYAAVRSMTVAIELTAALKERSKGGVIGCLHFVTRYKIPRDCGGWTFSIEPSRPSPKSSSGLLTTHLSESWKLAMNQRIVPPNGRRTEAARSRIFITN
jgi:hypothetical protein